ncbi:MAG: alpha/beta hydrolase [Bryobacteraceae bacterium]
MKLIARTALLIGLAAVSGLAQQVIPLPFRAASGASPQSYPEKQYFSKAWNTEVVANVTKPSLMVYQPLPWKANGAAVVICPGGGFMALSIDSEGIEVAEWLAAKGFTAFVLKYRLAHTGGDATEEFQHLWNGDKQRFGQILANTIPLSIADGLEAVAYVRKHASDWKVSPDRVGIMGFSAGGTVAAAVALRYSPESRPAFAAPIYPAASMFKDDPVRPDAPPIFLAAASDDQLGLSGDSVALYEKWTAAHKSAELHMYAKGGHGFGMRKQGLPSDEWIGRFWDWIQMEHIPKK